MFRESPLNTSYFPGNGQTLNNRTDFANFGQAWANQTASFTVYFPQTLIKN